MKFSLKSIQLKLRLPEIFIKIWKISSSFYSKNVALLTTFWVSLLSLAFFVSVAYQEIFLKYFPFFRVKWFGLISLTSILVITLITAILLNKSKTQKLFTWLESNILTLISFSYILGIENNLFYPFIISFLTSLIFLVNYDLFGKKEYYFYILVIQILLFCLQTFSWLNLLLDQRIDVITFNEDILRNILRLPSWFWLFLASCGVTLITFSSFKSKLGFRSTVSYILILFYLFFQLLVILENLNFNSFLYWQKSVLFLIVWDFLYFPIKSILSQEKDERYNLKLGVSVAYHIVLIMLIYLLPNFLAFI